MVIFKLKFEGHCQVKKLPSTGMAEAIDKVLLSKVHELLETLGLAPQNSFFKITFDIIKEDPEGVARG